MQVCSVCLLCLDACLYSSQYGHQTSVQRYFPVQGFSICQKISCLPDEQHCKELQSHELFTCHQCSGIYHNRICKPLSLSLLELLRQKLQPSQESAASGELFSNPKRSNHTSCGCPVDTIQRGASNQGALSSFLSSLLFSPSSSQVADTDTTGNEIRST